MQTDLYRHFKGKMYEVVGVARYSEDINQKFVVYKALYEGDFPAGQLWVRPKSMFMETIERDGKQVKRFEFVEE